LGPSPTFERVDVLLVDVARPFLLLLSDKVQSLKEQALQETPAGNIGKEVRLRYLGRIDSGWEATSVSSIMNAAHRG